MRKTGFLAVVLLAMSAAASGGCATIVSSTRQKIRVLSDPPDAWVRLDTGQQARTPCTVLAERAKTRSITVGKDGYQTVEVRIQRDFNYWVLGNVVFSAGVVVGAAVDYFAGAWYELSPNRIELVLQPVDGGAPPARNRPVRPAVPAGGTLQASLEDLRAELDTQFSGGDTPVRVAILPLLDLDSRPNRLGAYLAEGLTSRLPRSGTFQVVERRLIEKVISEQKFQSSQLVDPDSAAELGRLLGVDNVCIGTVSDLGSSVEINLRLIATRDAVVVGTAWSTVAKTADLEAMLAPQDER